MQVKILRNFKTIMRDGTALYGDLYRPDNDEKYPVVIMRTPYNKYNCELGDACYDPFKLAERGYNVFFQDVRGCYMSEGVLKSSGESEISDGYDTIEWAAAQPWCDGKVGLWGLSYFGYTQLAAAEQRPPHLVASCPWQMSGINPFSLGKYGTFGPFHLNWLYTQAISFIRADRKLPFPEKIALTKKLEENMAKIAEQVYTLPLRDLPAAYVEGYPLFLDFVEILDKIDDPEFRKRVHYPLDFGNMDVAMFHSAGWNDATHEGVVDNYEASVTLGKTERMKKGQKLVLGPWVHGGGLNHIVDHVNYGEQANGYQHGLPEMMYRWFDFWLKGVDNGILNEPPVDIFVMGANKWRQENEWPIARTQYTDFYLTGGKANSAHGNGALVSVPGKEGIDTYAYDPLNPTPSGAQDYSGARIITDRSSIIARDDVLVYVTPELEEDIEVTGHVRLKLTVSADVPDTDFCCMLSDVQPDGKVYVMSKGILRARYRNSVTKPEFLTPGEVYELDIDMGTTSNVFMKGHKIMLDIAGSSFPNVDRNVNTTAHVGAGKDAVTANVKVFFGGVKASKLVLPVIPK